MPFLFTTKNDEAMAMASFFITCININIKKYCGSDISGSWLFWNLMPISSQVVAAIQKILYVVDDNDLVITDAQKILEKYL